MPIYEDYLSDASLPTDSESDEEVPEESIYDERDEEYWNIEDLMDDHRPPPLIEYITKLGCVTLYGCITDPLRSDIESVVPIGSVRTWQSFWIRDGYVQQGEEFSYDDWDMIGEYCMQLCECCFENPSMERIRSCIIRILNLGKFVPRRAGRAVLPRAPRRR